MGAFDKYPYPYRKRVNLPAWIAQGIISVIFLGLYATILNMMNGLTSEQMWAFNKEDHIIEIGAARIATSSIAIFLVLAEIILVSLRRMYPGLFLASACIKTLIFGILFVLNLVVGAWIGYIADGLCMVTSLPQLVHGAWMVHQIRKGRTLAEKGQYVIPGAAGNVVGDDDNSVHNIHRGDIEEFGAAAVGWRHSQQQMQMLQQEQGSYEAYRSRASSIAPPAAVGAWAAPGERRSREGLVGGSAEYRSVSSSSDEREGHHDGVDTAYPGRDAAMGYYDNACGDVGYQTRINDMGEREVYR